MPKFKFCLNGKTWRGILIRKQLEAVIPDTRIVVQALCNPEEHGAEDTRDRFCGEGPVQVLGGFGKLSLVSTSTALITKSSLLNPVCR